LARRASNITVNTSSVGIAGINSAIVSVVAVDSLRSASYLLGAIVCTSIGCAFSAWANLVAVWN
jgi:actin-related protein